MSHEFKITKYLLSTGRLGQLIGLDLRYLFRHGAWSLASDGVQQAAGVASTLLLARFTSQETLGQYHLVLSAIAITAVVSINGFDIVLLRDAAHKLDGVYKRLTKTRFAWSLLSLPIMLLVAFYYKNAGQPTLAAAFLIAAILLPLYYTLQSWQNLYKGKLLFKEYAQLSIVRSLLVLSVTLLVLLLFRDNLSAIILAFLGAHVAVDAIAYWKSFATISNDETSSDWKAYGYFLSRVGIFKIFVTNIDKVLIGVLFSPAELAIYAIAVIIPNSVMLGFKSLFSIVLPRLSTKDRLTFRELIMAWLAGLLMTIVTMLATAWFLVPFFGDQYRIAVPMGLVASLALLFLPLGLLLNNFVFYRGNRRGVAMNQMVSPALKMILILFLASLWQTTGFVVVFALTPLLWTLTSLLSLRVNLKHRVVS